MREHARTMRRTEHESAEVAATTRAEKDKARINTAAIDDLLDEIDGLLEANAKEFVDSYVQHGGE